MICKEHFRLKRNGEPVKNRCYCRHPELIENYWRLSLDVLLSHHLRVGKGLKNPLLHGSNLRFIETCLR